MVLKLSGSSLSVAPPRSLNDFLMSSRRLRDTAKEFKDTASERIHPEQGMLYVHQHEFAVVDPDDNAARILGSEDATTCHIIILRHPTSHVTGLVHFDTMHEPSLDRLRSRLFSVSSERGHPSRDELSISIVGGYADEENRSEELSLTLLTHLATDPDITYTLDLCCIGSLNTTVKNGIAFPVHYGCAVDVSTGVVRPATFPDQGPEGVLRHIRCSFNRSSDGSYFDLYDCKEQCIRIEPFMPLKYPGMEFWCLAPKEIFLEQMSTSPKVEPECFVPRLKEAIKTVVEMDDPMRTVFYGGKTLTFRRNDRLEWTPMQGPHTSCQAELEETGTPTSSDLEVNNA